MLKIRSAGEDNPEELVKEEADAPTEGRAVLSVEVRLIQRNQAKDPPPMATQYDGTEDAVRGELLWRAEEKDDTAGVPLEAVQAGDKRIPHNVHQKLVNVMGFHQGIGQGPLPEPLQKISRQRKQRHEHQQEASGHGAHHPHDVRLSESNSIFLLLWTAEDGARACPTLVGTCGRGYHPRPRRPGRRSAHQGRCPLCTLSVRGGLPPKW